MIQNIVLIIILLTLAYLYEEFKKLRENTEAYPEKTNKFLTDLCDLIDHNSEMEEKILNKIAEKLEERGNE
jgi:hypothetical protein